MTIPALLAAIEKTQLAAAVGGQFAGSEWVFPIVETLHVIFLTLVFGSIFMIDTRLLGWSSLGSSVSKLSKEILPWTWIAFGCAVITGSILFTCKATEYYHNAQFRYKFLCMALAGLNMAVFHLGVYRHVNDWDAQKYPPVAARIAGALSIALWIGVIFFGRWIGFTT